MANIVGSALSVCDARPPHRLCARARGTRGSCGAVGPAPAGLPCALVTASLVGGLSSLVPTGPGAGSVLGSRQSRPLSGGHRPLQVGKQTLHGQDRANGVHRVCDGETEGRTWPRARTRRPSLEGPRGDESHRASAEGLVEGRRFSVFSFYTFWVSNPGTVLFLCKA